jgi:AAA15 family ATPase/GTPase
MAEKLIIKNFAGIKELEIEVKRINILIGPQASGKSVCAKLLYYFKNFIWEILDAVENEKDKRYLDSECIRTFKEYFPPDCWGNEDFLIRYEVSNYHLEIRKKIDNREDHLVMKYSDFFKEEYKRLRNYQKRIQTVDIDEDEFERYKRMQLNNRKLRTYFIEHLGTSLPKESCFAQLFIPAGRSFFANLQSNIFTFLASNNNLDPFLRDFGSTYETLKYYGLEPEIRGFARKEIRPLFEEMDRLTEKSLCGKYSQHKGEDFLIMENERQVRVSNSSSGQQETLPLTIILGALPYMSLSLGRSVYIEEPEAHLFPNAQRSIIELISTVFNFPMKNLQFFITTHSPYALTSINNLLQAGILYQDPNQATLSKLKKIIPQFKSLNTSDLSAYMLENGECHNIISPETGLIDARIIDSVSEDLAIEFDQLLDLA